MTGVGDRTGAGTVDRPRTEDHAAPPTTAEREPVAPPVMAGEVQEVRARPGKTAPKDKDKGKAPTKATAGEAPRVATKARPPR